MKLEEKPAKQGFLVHGPVTDGGTIMTPDRVALWWIFLDRIADSDWETLEAVISDEEHIRSERFHFDRDRQVYIAAHATCRGLLSYCLGGDPRSWRFSVEDHGKPELISPADGPRMRVNISHTRGLAAVALTVDHDIGVDVEWLQRNAETDKLAKRVFAARECRTLAAVPQARKLETFLSFWTLKEAYVKAIGKGLSQPLDAFSFDLDTLRIDFEDRLADDPAKWHFERYAPGPEHLMALAINHPEPARLTIDAMAAPLDYLHGVGV